MLALTGCAHSYVDADGNTHIAGLVHVVVPKSADAREVRGESIRVKSFGLTVLANPLRTNITLGYSDDTMVVVRNNACVAFGQSASDFPFRPTIATNNATRGGDNP